MQNERLDCLNYYRKLRLIGQLSRDERVFHRKFGVPNVVINTDEYRERALAELETESYSVSAVLR